MQVVKLSPAIPLQVRDIGADSEAQAYSFARKEIQRPFDLERGPLIRTALFRLAPEHHILVNTMHHIISDGWSAELFVHELAEHYAAFSTRREPVLKPLQMQYSDFTVLQRHLVASTRIEQQLAFWRRTLSGAPLLHGIPCDHPRPPQPTHAGASQSMRLNSELVADLQRFARGQRATFFMLLAATFQILLFKYSKHQDVLVGIPVMGRNLVESERLIGLFVNTIVLRTSLSEDLSFADVLHHVRDRILEAMSNQDAPFERIVDSVQAPRSPSHNPLFQIMFGTFRTALRSREFGQLVATPYIVDSATSRFDLSVNVIEDLDGTWWVQAEYSTELFNHARIATMLEVYRMVLGTMLTDSHQRLSDLRLPDSALDTSTNIPHPVTPPATTKMRAELTDRRAVSGPVRSSTHMATPAGAPHVPSGQVESQLVGIWQRFLKISPIALDSNFFDLGGNSLLAIRMIAEINRAFDRKIPVSALFHYPTIRQVATLVRERPLFKLSFFPLVETGTKPPLFVCADSRGASLLGATELSRALGPDQPFYQIDIYALQEERLISQEPLLTTVESMATHLIPEIISIQRSGPYFLAGQCAGGIIALEIARQLRQLGQEIAVLMQFDTPPTGYFRVRAWYRQALELSRRSDALLRILRFIDDRIRRMLRLKETMTKEQEDIWNIIWNAVRAYGNELVLFNGEITLFRATRGSITIEDVATGWSRIGTLRVFDVPSNHGQLFLSRDAQDIFRRVLDDAQRRPGTSRPQFDATPGERRVSR
jgi:thioesterase domain-containing protein/acyl carrier protein